MKKPKVKRKFKAVERVVWAEPVHTKHANGSTTINLGFPVCQVNENITNPEKVAKAIAKAMNAHF